MGGKQHPNHSTQFSKTQVPNTEPVLGTPSMYDRGTDKKAQ